MSSCPAKKTVTLLAVGPAENRFVFDEEDREVDGLDGELVVLLLLLLRGVDAEFFLAKLESISTNGCLTVEYMFLEFEEHLVL